MAKRKTASTLLDTIQLTPSQKHGEEIFHAWWKDKGFKKNKKQILRVGGPAGTGKSVFIQYLMEKYKLTKQNCLVVSYTGQAVNVLRQRGIPAKTIHSTFMHTVETPLLDQDGNPISRGGIPLITVKFVPVERISSAIKLIIIDESSFLPEDLEKLIKKYKVPILETGDPFQLPPVFGKQCFTMNTLDVLFTEIMRQEMDSDIVDIATRIREGAKIDPSKYHDEVLFIQPDGNLEDTFFRFRSFLLYSDCIITSTNKQRSVLTDLYRKYIMKTDHVYPVKGDRVICRKNNWNMTLGDFPLTNGTIGTVLYNVGRGSISTKAKTFTMDFMPDVVSNDYYDNILCDTDFLCGEFGDKQIDRFNPGNKFEYAHAITTHSAQGSQFPSVCFFDSFNRNEEYAMRLRYTAVTRAQKYLVYFLPHYWK